MAAQDKDILPGQVQMLLQAQAPVQATAQTKTDAQQKGIAQALIQHALAQPSAPAQAPVGTHLMTEANLLKPSHSQLGFYAYEKFPYLKFIIPSSNKSKETIEIINEMMSRYIILHPDLVKLINEVASSQHEIRVEFMSQDKSANVRWSSKTRTILLNMKFCSGDNIGLLLHFLIMKLCEANNQDVKKIRFKDYPTATLYADAITKVRHPLKNQMIDLLLKGENDYHLPFNPPCPKKNSFDLTVYKLKTPASFALGYESHYDFHVKRHLEFSIRLLEQSIAKKVKNFFAIDDATINANPKPCMEYAYNRAEEIKNLYFQLMDKKFELYDLEHRSKQAKYFLNSKLKDMQQDFEKTIKELTFYNYDREAVENYSIPLLNSNSLVLEKMAIESAADSEKDRMAYLLARKTISDEISSKRAEVQSKLSEINQKCLIRQVQIMIQSKNQHDTAQLTTVKKPKPSVAQVILPSKDSYTKVQYEHSKAKQDKKTDQQSPTALIDFQQTSAAINSLVTPTTASNNTGNQNNPTQTRNNDCCVIL